MACSFVGTKIFLQKVWEGRYWEGAWPSLGPTHSIQLLERPGEVWVSSNPFCLCGKPKACALIGLHFVSAEGEAGSSGSQSPDLGDTWEQGCPTRPKWFSSCSASVSFGDDEEYEHNNECRAIEVVGQDWSSEVVALVPEDLELG